MRKILPLMILLVLLYATGNSQQQVSLAEAKTAAINTMRYNRQMYSEDDISSVNTYESNGNTIVYEVKFNDNHSVLLSGSKACLPILGYNFSDEDESVLDKFGEIPPGLQSMIEEYIEQIEICFANDTMTLWHETDWAELMKFNKDKGEVTEVVSPLISTMWGQSRSNDTVVNSSNNPIYYNAYNYYVSETSTACGDNRHCPTGCAATAMAQIMNYWKHPVYKPWGPVQIDWCNMPDSLTLTSVNYEEERNAVAWLMRKCGLEVDMDYCIGGDCSSGANIKDVRSAFVDDFGYSNDATLKRKFWHPKKWLDYVKNDLNNRWPIYYRGGKSGEGHAFVCDGYRSDDTFHFNLGWNGKFRNWWLTLSSLIFKDDNYTYNFTSRQKAIFNIHPDYVSDYCDFSISLESYYNENISLSNTSTAVPRTFSVIESVSRESDLDEKYRTIYNGESNEYVAHKKVILKDGFHAEEGSHFISYIDECESCDGRSMDKSRSEDAGLQETVQTPSALPENQNAIDVFRIQMTGHFTSGVGET